MPLNDNCKTAIARKFIYPIRKKVENIVGCTLWTTH
jgi:hypothetical protein